MCCFARDGVPAAVPMKLLPVLLPVLLSVLQWRTQREPP
jgi:hypothetical protein